MAKHLTIRNVPDDVAEELDKERKRRDDSLNQTVIELLRRALGLVPGHEYRNGLERMAGTWSANELAEFEAAIACFEEVDPELWS